MTFQKFKADKLFDGYRFLADDQVLITDEKGFIRDIVNKSDAGDDVQELTGILTPGFINCHCHLELSHMKGMIPEAKGLVSFVQNVMQQRHFPDEEITEAIKKAEDEMLANGIVAVGDICNNTLTIAQKTKGRIYYHNFIEASGFNPSIAAQRFKSAKNMYEKFREALFSPSELSNFGAGSIVPHAPYSVADELWDLIIHFAGNHLFSIHNQETKEENDWFISKRGEFTALYKNLSIDTTFFAATGKSSLQSYLSKFLNDQPVILVHNVKTSEEDILFSQRIRDKGKFSWCLCPNANHYITRQLPDIDLLIKHNCEIVIGTDSLASNHQLNILEELKTIRKYYPYIEKEILLKWATSNGAKALQTDSFLGSFEKGKKPGVVLVQEDTFSALRLA